MSPESFIGVHQIFNCVCVSRSWKSSVKLTRTEEKMELIEKKNIYN